MLVPGSTARRIWIAGASALLSLSGRLGRQNAEASRACARRSPTTRNSTRAWPGSAQPAGAANCAAARSLSLPNNKLIPDARWILDSVGQHDIVARSEARADIAKGSHALANTN